MLEQGRFALYAPLWKEVLHAVQSLNDSESSATLHRSMVELFGLEV